MNTFDRPNDITALLIVISSSDCYFRKRQKIIEIGPRLHSETQIIKTSIFSEQDGKITNRGEVMVGTSPLGVADRLADIPILTLALPCDAFKNKFGIGL